MDVFIGLSGAYGKTGNAWDPLSGPSCAQHACSSSFSPLLPESVDHNTPVYIFPAAAAERRAWARVSEREEANITGPVIFCLRARHGITLCLCGGKGAL